MKAGGRLSGLDPAAALASLKSSDLGAKAKAAGGALRQVGGAKKRPKKQASKAELLAALGKKKTAKM